MEEIYEKLRERLDMFPQGFPSTESRVELEILRELFSPDEAEIMLFLRPTPEPPSAVAKWTSASRTGSPSCSSSTISR